MIDSRQTTNFNKWSVYSLLFLFCLTPLVIDYGFVDKYNPPKEHFFVFTTLLSLMVLSIKWWMKKTKTQIAVNAIDILVIVFQLLYIIPFVFKGKISVSFDVKWFSHVAMLLFYIFIRFSGTTLFGATSRTHNMRLLLIVLLVISILLVIYGYIQFTSNEMPRGTFDNSGPFTNYLSVIFTLAFGAFFFKITVSKIHKIITVLFLIACTILLVLVKSRAAWLASAIGVVLVILSSKNLRLLFEKYRVSLIHKVIFVVVLTTLVFASGWSIYQLKKDSADGRLLIWKTALHTIADKPMLGHGFEEFQAERNKSQSSYFKENWDQQNEKRLAGTNIYAFNDFLEITGEVGLIGLIIFLALLIFVFRISIGSDNSFLLLLGISIFVLLITSLFSYSLQRVPTSMFFFFFIALISADMKSQKVLTLKFNTLTKRVTATIIIPVALIIMVWQVRTIQAQHRWKEVHNIYKKGDKQKAFIFYNKLYPILKSDPYFLFNYGTTLSLEKMYLPSTNILEECNEKLYDYDALLFLGINYQNMGMVHEAEACYLDATYLIPHKFLSRYRLVKLYGATNETQKAMKWAMDILNEDPKIPSETVDDIKKEMVQFVNKQSKTLRNQQ